MKARRISIIILIAVPMTFGAFIDAGAQSGRKPLQNNIASGKYIHNDLVTMFNVKQLPVPATNDDYAIFQSIGKVSNVIIGRFKKGARQVVLITDNDADGKVDFACVWNVDGGAVDITPKPETVYGEAQFRQMKDEIVNGKSGLVSPNPEGIAYMRVLLERTSNIIKMRNGFRVSGSDPDVVGLERVNYFFSDNGVHGADLAFEVKYNNIGQIRVIPIITVWVYCKDSSDPFVIETVKKLNAEAAERFFKK
ncbi:MAG TPA: hypothetical protein VLM75_03650 [Spirochaetota bacterium]|nr:hypothetical protein [Spirochaetota bacterium]